MVRGTSVGSLTDMKCPDKIVNLHAPRKISGGTLLPSMDQVFVVLDTNIFMHYTWFLEYPWQEHEELHGKMVTLVFVRPVIDELNDHKDKHPRGGVRKRCLRVLTWVYENLSDTMGTDIKVGSNLFARLDMKSYSSQISVLADDRILEYAQGYGEDIVVCTHDHNMKIYARSHRISVVEPSAGQRITEEEETELQAAQKELQILKNRLPRLSVETPGGEVRYAQTNLPLDSKKFISDRLTALNVCRPAKVDLFPFADIQNVIAVQNAPGIDDYDPAEVEEYRVGLMQALALSIVLGEQICASPIVQLSVSNSGTCPATKVKVRIEGPPSVLIFSLDEFILPPLPPRPKRGLVKWLTPPTAATSGSRYVRRPPGITFAASDSTATWSANRIAHHETLHIPEFLVLRTRPDADEKFGLEVSIFADELPHLQKFSIPVKLAEESDEDVRRVDWITDELRKHFDENRKSL